MHSLLDFLTAAPKTFVIKIHRRQHPGEGLMQASKVVQLVYDWAVGKKRLAGVLGELDGPARRLLDLIYVGENRGASEKEILAGADDASPTQIFSSLGKLQRELLIFSRESESGRSYHGFHEMAAWLSPALPHAAWEDRPEKANWISYRHFLSAHLCHFLCQADLGELKITQTGELHRKNQQDLSQKFAFGEKLSAVLPGEEIQFLLRFAAQEGLILQEDGRLHLSAAGRELLLGDRREAERRLMEWWAAKRVRGMERGLAALAKAEASSATAYRIAPLADLLWIHTGIYRKQYRDAKALFTWENLPKTVQELWLLGRLELGVAKGRIGWFRMGGESRDAHTASQRPISLANLESLVPLASPLSRQRQVELLGRKSNDELMVRYHFTKDSVIQGLQAGIGMEAFADVLAWLGYEGPATRALLDWGSNYASTVFLDGTVLKISDPERFRELREIPQFMELIRETIPGYGFLLSRENQPRVKELLRHFGLVPGEDARRNFNLEPVIPDVSGAPWEFPVPETGAAAYREDAPPPRGSGEVLDKQDPAFREQEAGRRIEAIESAISGEKQLELNYQVPAPRRVVMRPLLLLKQKTPVKLIGIEVDTGHRNEYLLEQVKSLRVIE